MGGKNPSMLCAQAQRGPSHWLRGGRRGGSRPVTSRAQAQERLRAPEARGGPEVDAGLRSGSRWAMGHGALREKLRELGEKPTLVEADGAREGPGGVT